MRAQQLANEKHEKEAEVIWLFTIWMGLNTDMQPVKLSAQHTSSTKMYLFRALTEQSFGPALKSFFNVMEENGLIKRSAEKMMRITTVRLTSTKLNPKKLLNREVAYCFSAPFLLNGLYPQHFFPSNNDGPSVLRGDGPSISGRCEGASVFSIV